MIFNPSDIRTLIHVATRKTGTPVHDEDLEQDVALRALAAFRRLDEVTHPRALLMKIVRDTLRDHWRKKRHSEELSEVDERITAFMPAVESRLDLEKQLEQLRLSLRRLPAAKRALLELFYIKDHSIREIAASQNRSISAVKMELARARRSLFRIFRSLSNSRRKAD
jgi:RNA polymerase sigma-70 factor, ECF subfamily